jgi:integrase
LQFNCNQADKPRRDLSNFSVAATRKSRWGFPSAQVNAVKNAERAKLSNAKLRYPKPDEAARLHKAAADSDNLQLPAFVTTALLTGPRKFEILKAKRANVALDARFWLLP